MGPAITQMPSAAELDGVLAQLLMPNSDAIKAAEVIVKEFTKLPASTPALLERVKTSPSPQVRQLAAVLARRKCIRHWSLLDEAVQTEIKSNLLHMLSNEPEHLVRRSIAEVTSSIAKMALPAGQWPELLDCMLQLSQSQHAEHREVALVVFMSLTDSLGDQMRSQFTTLGGIFATGLSDPSAPVRLAALKAVQSLVQWLETPEEMQMGTEMIPRLLTVAQQCLEAGDEDTPIQVFEMLAECAEGSYGIIEGCLANIVKVMIDVAVSERLDIRVRHKAMFVVQELCHLKAKTLKKKNLVDPILKAIFLLSTQAGEEDEEDAEEEGEEQMTPYKMGTSCLDALAIQLPSRQIMPNVMHHVSAAMQNPNKLHRRGALYLLGTCSEGCSESVGENLETIVPWLSGGFSDPSQEVQLAACWSMTQFAEFLQPDELMEHYEELLPGVIGTLQATHPLVQKRGCIALESFCDNLSEELVPFLQTIMDNLSILFQSQNTELKELAMSAVAGAAGAVGEAFLPYFPSTMEVVCLCMASTDDEGFALRARATEAGGVLAAALGREVFEPHLESFVRVCMEGLALDSNEVREYTYGAFSNIATILKEDFAPLAVSVMPKLLLSCDSEDGIDVLKSADAFNGIAGDEEDEEEDIKAINVRTAWLDEKSSAISTVAAIAEGMGCAFLPYLEQCLACIRKLSGYFHEDVRQNVVKALKSLLLVSFKALSLPLRTNGGDALHPDTSRLLDEVMQELLNTLENDDDKETVAQGCEALTLLLPEIGAVAFSKHLQRLLELAFGLLEGQTTCQGGDDEDDEEEDHDQVLMDAVAEFVGAMSKAWGQQFTPHFSVLFGSLQKYFKDSRGAQDKLMAIGCMAEVFSNIGDGCVPYIPTLLPVLAAGLQDGNPGLRRNSAFCCGVLCKEGTAAMQPYFLQILAGLEPLIKDDEESEVRDNAVGAMARMLLAAPEQVPIPAILQVIFDNSPLDGDAEENNVTVSAIFHVLNSAPDVMNPFLGKLIALFAALLSDPKLSKELEETIPSQMVQVIVTLKGQYGGEVMQVVASLPPEQQNWLAQNVPS